MDCFKPLHVSQFIQTRGSGHLGFFIFLFCLGVFCGLLFFLGFGVGFGFYFLFFVSLNTVYLSDCWLFSCPLLTPGNNFFLCVSILGFLLSTDLCWVYLSEQAQKRRRELKFLLNWSQLVLQFEAQENHPLNQSTSEGSLQVCFPRRNQDAVLSPSWS